jgi:hypothetical protein
MVLPTQIDRGDHDRAKATEILTGAHRSLWFWSDQGRVGFITSVCSSKANSRLTRDKSRAEPPRLAARRPDPNSACVHDTEHKGIIVRKPHTKFGIDRTLEVSGFSDLMSPCDLAATLVESSDCDRNEYAPVGADRGDLFPNPCAPCHEIAHCVGGDALNGRVPYIPLGFDRLVLDRHKEIK